MPLTAEEIQEFNEAWRKVSDLANRNFTIAQNNLRTVQYAGVLSILNFIIFLFLLYKGCS